MKAVQRHIGNLDALVIMRLGTEHAGTGETVETTRRPYRYLQASFSTNRGAMSYNQFMFSLGYGFDSSKEGRMKYHRR
jgi:hypothetical protein